MINDLEKRRPGRPRLSGPVIELGNSVIEHADHGDESDNQPAPYLYDAGDGPDRVSTTPLYQHADPKLPRSPLFRFKRDGGLVTKTYRMGDQSGYNPVTIERIAKSMFDDLWSYALQSLADKAFSVDNEITITIDVR